MINNSVLNTLLKKFPANEYALMQEVRDGAGFSASRSADFLAMSLWPSRGLELIGLERKSYRGDWLKELKTPEKAENIFQYCDKWYLLTDNDNVAKLEEIPQTWGWMHINENGKLSVLKEAPKLNPVAISKSFLACILKRANCKKGWITLESIDQKLAAAKEQGKNERDYSNKRQLEAYQVLLKDVQAFEEVTGIKLLNPKWGTTGKKLGEIVRFIENGGIDGMAKDIAYIKNYHSSIGRSIDAFEALNLSRTN